MLIWIKTIYFFVTSLFKSNEQLLKKSTLLYNQLQTSRKKNGKPNLDNWDRFFWVIISKVCKNWKDYLFIVKPETVIGWHRKLFKRYWRQKSTTKKRGRPPITKEVRELIIQMAVDNHLWGAPRIHGELLMLGFDISEKTISNILRKYKPPSSQGWSTFLKNHVGAVVASDFFTIPTINFRLIYVFLIMNLRTRKIEGFEITQHPTAKWTADTFKESFADNDYPEYLIRDRDCIYGKVFQEQLNELDVEEHVIDFKCPWQNGYVERMIGSIKRECLNHMIILNKKHLQSVLTEYLDYYHNDRTHIALQKETPEKRSVEILPDNIIEIFKEPKLNGLHHRYRLKKVA